MTVVLDAGAVIDLLLGRPAARDVAAALRYELDDAHAPELLDLEVLSALRRLGAAGELSDERADAALDDLAALPLLRHGHGPLVPRVWRLRANMTPYDATYVALAEGLGPETVLITLDRRLERAVAAHTEVKVVVPEAPR